MKKGLGKLIVFIILSIILIVVVIFLINENNNRIPTNYIAIFSGKADGENYSTYIYKLNNKSDDYGYSFINIRGTKKSYKILSKGETSWKDQLFEVAKSNNAYKSVNYEGKDYTIDEFADLFLPKQPAPLEPFE